MAGVRVKGEGLAGEARAWGWEGRLQGTGREVGLWLRKAWAGKVCSYPAFEIGYRLTTSPYAYLTVISVLFYSRIVSPAPRQEFLAEVVEKLPTFAPQHLATLLGAMGRLAVATGPAPGPGSAPAAAAAAAAAGTSSQAAAAAAAAAAAGRVRPPSPGWAAAVAQHMEGRMPTFNGPSLATAAWGLSMLGFRPSPKVRRCGVVSQLTWFDVVCGM